MPLFNVNIIIMYTLYIKIKYTVRLGLIVFFPCNQGNLEINKNKTNTSSFIFFLILYKKLKSNE